MAGTLGTAVAIQAVGAAPLERSAPTTVWLCRPGMVNDPCAPGLSTTLYSPRLVRQGVVRPSVSRRVPIDCFYVYPTVSDQRTGNANLDIDPEERSIALYQAARYSQVCRVFAPMYRQVTLAGIGRGTPTTRPSANLAFASLQAAFDDYLRHDNDGRGFVLIGHSQGAFLLRRLIAEDVDAVQSVRARLVSAILLGGNVLVRPGPSGVGGDFSHIPACRSQNQTGCVVAFSTFDDPPPPNSVFGRPPAGSTDVVLCTNPASLGGGAGRLTPIVPTAPFAPGTLIAAGISLLHLPTPSPPPTTVWYAMPDAYEARCVSSGGANVLEVTPLGGAPKPVPSPDAAWGLHLLDANIALGNLVGLVHDQSVAYLSRHR